MKNCYLKLILNTIGDQGERGLTGEKGIIFYYCVISLTNLIITGDRGFKGEIGEKGIGL